MFNFKKITRTALLALAAPVTAGFMAMAPTPADAIGFQNCTGNDLRVHVYNNGDTVKAIALKGGRINAGDLKIWRKVPKRTMAIKVFKTGFPDSLVLSESALKHNWDYRIKLSSNGRYSVVPAGHPVRSCPR